MSNKTTNMAPEVKAQLQKARQLIREKRYSEARRILTRIDHPTAEEWLEKLERLDPQPTSTSFLSKRLKVGLLIAGLVIIVFFVIGQMNEQRNIDARIRSLREDSASDYCIDRYVFGSNAYYECIENRTGE